MIKKVSTIKYNQSSTVEKLIAQVMINGKRGKAEGIVFSALQKISEESKCYASVVLVKALINVCPVMEVKSKRVGGGFFQVPFPIAKKKQVALGICWLVKNAKKRRGRSMTNRLAREILDAAKGYGGSVRTRELQHSLVRKNRAFAHFRW